MKCRILEYKGRIDLLIWASRKMPAVRLDMMSYPIRKDWPDLFAESSRHPIDDGHLAKFVRTVAHAEQLCEPYEQDPDACWLQVKGDMYLRIANMGMFIILVLQLLK